MQLSGDEPSPAIGFNSKSDPSLKIQALVLPGKQNVAA